MLGALLVQRGRRGQSVHGSQQVECGELIEVFGGWVAGFGQQLVELFHTMSLLRDGSVEDWMIKSLQAAAGCAFQLEDDNFILT